MNKLPKLRTLPGQPGVPEFAAPWSAALIMACETLPPPKATDRKLKSFQVAPTGVGVSRGKGAAEKVKTAQELETEAAVLAHECPPANKAHKTAYASIFSQLSESTVLRIVNEDDAPGVDLNDFLKITFVRQEQASPLNTQFRRAFEQRNDGKYSGDSVSFGGEFLITGTMPPGVKGFSVSMTNSFEPCDAYGNDTTVSCHVYFIATRVPDGLYSEAAMSRWPPGEREEFLALPSPPMHLSLLDMAQWHVWNDCSSSTWNLAGSHEDKLLFCGTDVSDKMSVNYSSLMFPAVLDGDKFMSTKAGHKEQNPSPEMQESPEPQEGETECSGVVTQTGSIGQVVLEQKADSLLFDDCDPFSLCAVFYGVKTLITLPSSFCVLCRNIKEKNAIGSCGHSMCSQCYIKCESAAKAGRRALCPLCSSVMDPFARSHGQKRPLPQA